MVLGKIVSLNSMYLILDSRRLRPARAIIFCPLLLHPHVPQHVRQPSPNPYPLALTAGGNRVRCASTLSHRMWRRRRRRRSDHAYGWTDGAANNSFFPSPLPTTAKEKHHLDIPFPSPGEEEAPPMATGGNDTLQQLQRGFFLLLPSQGARNLRSASTQQ